MIVFPINMMSRLVAFTSAKGTKRSTPVALVISLCLFFFASSARADQTGSVAGGWIDIDSGTTFFGTPEALCGPGIVSYEAEDQVTCCGPGTVSCDWRKYGVLAYACRPGYLPNGYISETWEMTHLGAASGYGVAENGVVYLGVGRSGLCGSQARPKVIAIDPGHGFNCPAKGMQLGAVGVTDFLPNNPPAGRLREDDLTMAIAREVQRILPTSKYRIVLTKRDANECPDYWERGRIANIAKAKAFVSIHINSKLVVPYTDWAIPAAHGTSVLYNVQKSGSFNLAESMARAVSSSLGVNNRGVKVDDEIAVLKPTVTKMEIAVLVESARLSADDETKLHTSGSATRIATGIKAALDESLGN